MTDRKRHATTLAAALAASLFVNWPLIGPGAAQELRTLRGNVGIEDINPPPEVLKQLIPGDGMFGRAYRQQPPLISHRIDGQQITKDSNQCLTCHDWPANIKEHAPKPSESHYTDRDGNRLDRISGARFFCTQCHVPQADARPLVTNTFRDASQTK